MPVLFLVIVPITLPFILKVWKQTQRNLRIYLTLCKMWQAQGLSCLKQRVDEKTESLREVKWLAKVHNEWLWTTYPLGSSIKSAMTLTVSLSFGPVSVRVLSDSPSLMVFFSLVFPTLQLWHPVTFGCSHIFNFILKHRTFLIKKFL